MDSKKQYEAKKEQLINQFLELKKQGKVGLEKSYSNLFRPRETKATNKINVKSFNKVIHIDTIGKIAEVEAMTTYEDLVKETLKYGLLPSVVPQLKTITMGGAVSGIGIEASSFRYGLVHETVSEVEVLLSDGKIVKATRNNEYKDLFLALPNSYGTLGYILKLKVKLVPAKRFVEIKHLRYHDSKKYFEDLKILCEKNIYHKHPETIDFIDGTIFSNNEMYITLGKFVDNSPFVSNYKYMKMYFKSIQILTKFDQKDYLKTSEYIWRWDADWFWCSKHFLMQNMLARFVFGKFMLNSKSYQKIRKINAKIFDDTFSKKVSKEWIIQDVGIPIENCIKFLNFFIKEIRILPIWVCPFSSFDKKTIYPLFRNNPKKRYVDFGFWDFVKTNKEPGFYNKKIEKTVAKLKGLKSLYSSSYYDKKTFWKLYNGKHYFKIKKKYDKERAFKDLYEKCVLRN